MSTVILSGVMGTVPADGCSSWGSNPTISHTKCTKFTSTPRMLLIRVFINPGWVLKHFIRLIRLLLFLLNKLFIHLY